MLAKITAVVLSALLSVAAFASTDGEKEGAKYKKEGFVTAIEKGRLWVFAEGSKELEGFRQHGEPSVSVVNIGTGPEGMTVKSYSQDVLDAYLKAEK